MVLGLLVYVILIHWLHNCLSSRLLLRYLATAILQIVLVHVLLYVKDQLCCLGTVTFVK